MVDVASGTAIESGLGFTIGDIIGRTFSIFLRNFVPFVLLSAIATIPYIFFFWSQSAAPAAPAKFDASLSLPFIIGFALKMLTEAVIVYAAFQDMRGLPVAIGESFRIGFAQFLPVIGLMIVEGLGITLGMILLIVPGLILLLMWYVALPVCVVEKLGPIESLRRSAELTKGHRWKLLGLLLIVGIIGSVLNAIFPYLGKLLLGRAGFVIVQYLAQAIVGAFGAILIIVIYRDLRVAKEGIDTERIAAVFD